MPCGNVGIFDPHALWYLFERKGWNDKLPAVREKNALPSILSCKAEADVGNARTNIRGSHATAANAGSPNGSGNCGAVDNACIASRAGQNVRMGWRDNLTMAAIGGSSSLAMIAVYIGATQAGMKAGEWLQFSAVFLGVAATIGGTLWLQGHTERRRAERRVVNLLRSLDIPLQFLRKLSDRPTAKDGPLLESIDRAFAHVKWARDQLEAPSYVTHAIVESLLEIWNSHRPELAENLKYAKLYPAQPAPQVSEAADFVIEWIERTAATIKREENASRAG